MARLLPPILAGIPGSWEIWVILLVILLLFGSRIPKVARSLGQGISQFKKGLNEGAAELADDDDDDDETPRPPAKKKKAAAASDETQSSDA